MSWLGRLVLLATLCLVSGCCQPVCEVVDVEETVIAEKPLGALPLYTPASADDAFLNELQHRIFKYFWNEVYPETGIAIDHTENREGKVAATGFELAAVCIGIERGWITYEQGYERVERVLNAFYDDPDDPDDAYADGQFGLYWHFVDGVTGRMKPIDCVAMCDSADFIAGVIVAGEYFKGTPLEALAEKIYDEVEWDQFVSPLPDGSPGLLSFGWVPLHTSESYWETDGLLGFNMGGLADNSLLIYCMALGSDTHPIPVDTWDMYVDSFRLEEYAGYECVAVGALFSRQVPHSFIRFSRKRDRKMDYFLDAVNAILADRVFNMRVNGYPPQVWGLNDCFGKDSYSHGAPPGHVQNDGTVAMTSIAGAVPHVPQIALGSMKYVYSNYKDQIWGEYGFTSSLNLQNGFISPLYVGIELGPMMQLIENYRTGLIWDLFMRSRVMKNFVKRARMSGVVDDFELPPESPPYADWSLEEGYVAVADDRPQSGKKYLELHPEDRSFELVGHLTENDLLDWHFERYLSLWVRDLELNAVTLMIDQRRVQLTDVGKVGAGAWMNYYYELPPHYATSMLAAVIIEGEALQEAPAIDNLTLEYEVDMGAPRKISDFKAQPSAYGGCIELGWTVPEDEGSDAVGGYMLLMSRQPFDPASYDPSQVKQIKIRGSRAAGERGGRTHSIPTDGDYYFAIAAHDDHGHWSDYTHVVSAQRNPETLDAVAYDFEESSFEGWEPGSTGITFQIVSGPGNRSLRIDYRKAHGWDMAMFPVDPRMVSIHRFITMKVKGDLELLGKLWCYHEKQEDMNRVSTSSMDEWTEVTFDTRQANLMEHDFTQVQKMILFPEPGEAERTGHFYVDDIRYVGLQ